MQGCYLIGSPGAGKSTLMRGLTWDAEWYVGKQPFKHLCYVTIEDGVVAIQLGDEHETFPGTDRLSMAVQPDAIAFVQSAPAPFVFGEGDRLATVGFLTAFAEACDEGFTLLWLDTPDMLAASRSAARSSQNEAWQKGRRAKVRNLASILDPVRLDGTNPADELVAHARELVPAFERLRTLPPVDGRG